MKNLKIQRTKLKKEFKELALYHMKALVDVARESFLILDEKLLVLSANSIFYKSFKVNPRQTENKLLYKLGNGQWNIFELRKLLEEILPKEKIVKDYEVHHFFPKIGEKTMLLNAKQIDSVQLIILAIEDITSRKNLENKLAEYTEGLESKIAERTKDLAEKIEELELLNKTMVGRELKMVELKKEIENLKKRTKNGNKNSNLNHKKRAKIKMADKNETSNS